MTQSTFKNNLVVRGRVPCTNYLEGFFHCSGGSRGGARGGGGGGGSTLIFRTNAEKIWGTTPSPPLHYVRIWMTERPPYLMVRIQHCTVSQVLLISIVATLSQHKTCKRLSSVTQQKHARSSNKTWQAHFLIQTPNKNKRKA